jgi:hypothetical protein
MHHYRCQNVYITATVSERIVNTLEFSPHNSPMPQMSSTDHVLMAAQDMTDALKHPHPDVPLATIGDDTISALATLAKIFTRKFKKAEAPEIPLAPIKSAANKQPESRVQPTLTPPPKTPISNEISNPRQPGIPQRATTCERGHTSNKECSTSKGANRGAPTFSAKFVLIFLGHGWR